jgi:hypothetical protein
LVFARKLMMVFSPHVRNAPIKFIGKSIRKICPTLSMEIISINGKVKPLYTPICKAALQ